jgi:hypothetical protein
MTVQSDAQRHLYRCATFLAGRKLIAAGTAITPEQAADPSVDLKALR